MSMPCVSVVLPVYNGEKYLREAVESILAQTFTDFELIIINDGSTDSSESILKVFQKQDKRIKLISRDHKGLTFTLNEGINYVRGQYLARMDADDIALPERLAREVAFLENSPGHVAVGCGVSLIDPEGWPICPLKNPTTHEEIDHKHISGSSSSYIVHPAVMIRFDVIKKLGGYSPETEPAEDLDLFLRLAEVGKIANLKEILLKYRVHPESIGHARYFEQRKAAYLVVVEACHRRGHKLPTKFEKEFKDQVSVPVENFHQRWAWWALTGGNVATARKHALLSLKHNPISLQSWKVCACAIRGY